MSGKIKVCLMTLLVIAILSATAAAQEVTRSISQKEVLPGQVVTVELTASQNLGSPIFGEVLLLYESFPGTYVNGSVRCIEGCDGVEYNESLGAFVVIDIPPLNETRIEYSIIAPTTLGQHHFNGTYQEIFTNTTGTIIGDNTTTVVNKTLVSVEPTEVYWGEPVNVTVEVTTPNGYPVPNVTVTISGDVTGFYDTNITNESGIAVFNIIPRQDDKSLIVNATYTYDNITISNETQITVRQPVNTTYVYCYARIENLERPIPLRNKNISIYINFDNRIKPDRPYVNRTTNENGEFVFSVSSNRSATLYIWIETEVEQIGNYVETKFETKEHPGRVQIEPGTTSVQANVPVNATINVTYPNNTVVQVFDDLNNIWSQHRSLDTKPKKADGVSKFKVRMQVMLGDEPYNLTNLSQALSDLGIDMTLPKSVYVCINDTNIAVIDSNGQACDYIPLNLDNSTAIFYVRSNASTDPSELRPENTGIINITGWYNYTIIQGTQSMNTGNVVNLTDYDYADFEGTGYIAGEVLDGETMHSIAGATVYVKWFNGTTWVNATDFEGKPINTTTDEYGHYKLEVISGRIYRVYAEKAGYTGCVPSTNVSVELGKTSTADVVLIKPSEEESEINPDPVPDDLEQLVTKYYPSFDWKTETPTKDDVVNAVINAVNEYFSPTTTTTEKQQILNDVINLVNLYFTYISS